LTLIVNKHPNASQMLTAGLGTIGVRIPAHPMTTELLEGLSSPMAVTSANVHGMHSPKNAFEVEAQLGNSIKYILDGGECEIGEESTIIGIDSGKIKLYRKGAIPLAQLQQALQ